MGLADIARAKQIQKQLDRLQSVQDAEERDRHAYKFATYQGKDPVDGTDIVAVDGVKTSGFRLMSNAPLEIGDRVNLRPNQQGLQRVDAKNVAPVVAPEIPERKIIPIDSNFVWGFAFVADYSLTATLYDDSSNEIGSSSYSGRMLSRQASISQGLYDFETRELVKKINFDFLGQPSSSATVIYSDSIDGYRFAVTVKFTPTVALGKLTNINFGISYQDNQTLPPDGWYWDYSFSYSNTSILPIGYYNSIPFKDGKLLFNNIDPKDSFGRYISEIYVNDVLTNTYDLTDNTINWLSLDGALSIPILPDIDNPISGDFSSREISIPDFYDGESRPVNYYWRFKKFGAAWLDLG